MLQRRDCIWWMLLGSPVCAQNDYPLFLGRGGGGKGIKSPLPLFLGPPLADLVGGSVGNFNILNNGIKKLTLVLCEAMISVLKTPKETSTSFQQEH